MNDERLAWLLRCAARLRGEERGAINLPAVLNQFGVDVRRLISETAARSPVGILGRKKNGDFVIGIKTAEPTFLWQPRDRFTIAHELGHLLLIRKWNYSPPPEQRREYFACEALCNRFAGHLLIDPRAIAVEPAASAEVYLEKVRTLSRCFDVSMEVAAREFVQAHTQTMVCSVQPLQDGRGSQILWMVSSLGKLRQTRGHIFKDIPPERACFRWYEKSTNKISHEPPDVCVRSSRYRSSLAVLVAGDPQPQGTKTAPPAEDTCSVSLDGGHTGRSCTSPEFGAAPPREEIPTNCWQLGQDAAWYDQSQSACVPSQTSFSFIDDKNGNPARTTPDGKDGGPPAVCSRRPRASHRQ